MLGRGFVRSREHMVDRRPTARRTIQVFGYSVTVCPQNGNIISRCTNGQNDTGKQERQ